MSDGNWGSHGGQGGPKDVQARSRDVLGIVPGTWCVLCPLLVFIVIFMVMVTPQIESMEGGEGFLSWRRKALWEQCWG